MISPRFCDPNCRLDMNVNGPYPVTTPEAAVCATNTTGFWVTVSGRPRASSRWKNAGKDESLCSATMPFAFLVSGLLSISIGGSNSSPFEPMTDSRYGLRPSCCCPETVGAPLRFSANGECPVARTMQSTTSSTPAIAKAPATTGRMLLVFARLTSPP